MKKLIFVMAALSLAFVGCNTDKEFEQPVENKALKVVVNMDKPSFGDDTRAARTDWEDGDEVICTMGGPGTGIRLTYDADSNSWTTKIFQKSVSGTNYREVDFDEVMASFLENPEDAEGPVMAAYFSSGIHILEFVEPPTTPLPAMVIATNAARISMGECVMTCENGTYKVEETASEYVLTLDITMKPQVAQYTIRNLNVEDGWNISIEGPVNGYAGGKITPDGVELTLIEDVLYGYPHQNGNDISIFAAPWQSNADIPDFIRSLPGYEITSEESYKEPYVFTVHDEDTYWFEREFDYKAVEIGDAVIMNGPTTSGAEGWN
jgi:hypothetical protein